MHHKTCCAHARVRNKTGAHAVVAGGAYGVAQGRPPLKQLVAGWLSTLQQLPRDGNKERMLQVGGWVCFLV